MTKKYLWALAATCFFIGTEAAWAKIIFQPPALSPEKAIALAKAYVKENNIDVSKDYLAKIEYINFYEELTKPSWQIEWKPISPVKGGQVFIDVYPDKKIAVTYGE